jgi:sporulation protein YlmC with PRC-barrel domain
MDPVTEAAIGDQDTADAPMVRDGYAAVPAAEYTAETLTGARVYDAADVWVGDVSDLILTEDGRVTAMVVDVGGFLGIGEKPVSLDLGQVEILRTSDGRDLRVYLSQTKAELEAMPAWES